MTSWATVPRAALAVLAVLAALTIAGLVAYWPSSAPDEALAVAGATETYRAEVTAVRSGPCPASTMQGCVTVESRLEEGPDEREVVAFPAGVTAGDPQFGVGDAIRLSASGPEAVGQGLPPYAFADFERRSPMLFLVAAFAVVVLLFGRWRGLRSIGGLVVSIGIIVVFLIPSMLDGNPSLPVALVAALAVMLSTLALAHGLGPKSIAAALGTTASLLLTALLAVIFTDLANISGFSSEEAVILQQGDAELSVQGLVIAGMVIAALGVLDDVTVSQASAVLALKRAQAAMPFVRLYREAIDIGRDHVAATVNTLVLAYVGASLPVLLVFSVGETPFADAVNREAVSEAVVGTLVGSIGLIAAVPLTTAVAAALAVRMPEIPDEPGHAH